MDDVDDHTVLDLVLRARDEFGGDPGIAVDVAYELTVTGSDPDGDPVILSADPLPAGATFGGWWRRASRLRN